MKSSLKIVWKTKITFLLSGTFLFFLKQKYILFLATYFFKILIKHLIASAFFLPKQILKNIDLPRQKTQHLPIAEANFERWGFGKVCFNTYRLLVNKEHLLHIVHVTRSEVLEMSRKKPLTSIEALQSNY